MALRMIAVFGVALALAPVGAWAASNQDPNHNSAAVQTAAVATPSAPSPTAQVQQVSTNPAPAQSAQQAGMSKPVKVYWFLSGR